MAQDKLYPIGFISRAHGLRGELIFVPDANLQSDPAGEIFLRPRAGGESRPFRVLACRRREGRALLSLEGISDRNAAQALCAHTVLKPAGDFAGGESLPLAALPGFRVFVPDAFGAEQELGLIREAQCPAGQTIWTIIDAEGREILFPAVSAFILSLDPEKGEARISPPPGLLDIYQQP
ncbi:MAG: hypothetical protein LBN33_04315 [Desulfovibrio sp.]|jgi:16S rRNA processing protein RimM|nr:hypothetical protein [Desulfovibrio sp.]